MFIGHEEMIKVTFNVIRGFPHLHIFKMAAKKCPNIEIHLLGHISTSNYYFGVILMLYYVLGTLQDRLRLTFIVIRCLPHLHIFKMAAMKCRNNFFGHILNSI
jgi:hypothetical protein